MLKCTKKCLAKKCPLKKLEVRNPLPLPPSWAVHCVLRADDEFASVWSLWILTKRNTKQHWFCLCTVSLVTIFFSSLTLLFVTSCPVRCPLTNKMFKYVQNENHCKTASGQLIKHIKIIMQLQLCEIITRMFATCCQTRVVIRQSALHTFPRV